MMIYIVTEQGLTEVSAEIEQFLSARIDELAELSVRAVHSLQKEDIVTVRDLVSKTETEILNIENLGIKSIEEMRQLMLGRDLSFGMKFLDDFATRPSGYRVKLPSSLAGVLNLEIRKHPVVSPEIAELLEKNGITRLGDLYVKQQEDTLRMTVNIKVITELLRLVNTFGLLQGAPITRERNIWYLAVPASDVIPLP